MSSAAGPSTRALHPISPAFWPQPRFSYSVCGACLTWDVQESSTGCLSGPGGCSPILQVIKIIFGYQLAGRLVSGCAVRSNEGGDVTRRALR